MPTTSTTMKQPRQKQEKTASQKYQQKTLFSSSFLAQKSNQNSTGKAETTTTAPATATATATATTTRTTNHNNSTKIIGGDQPHSRQPAVIEHAIITNQNDDETLNRRRNRLPGADDVPEPSTIQDDNHGTTINAKIVVENEQVEVISTESNDIAIRSNENSKTKPNDNQVSLTLVPTVSSSSSSSTMENMTETTTKAMFRVSTASTPQEFVKQLSLQMFHNNDQQAKQFLEHCLQSFTVRTESTDIKGKVNDVTTKVVSPIITKNPSTNVTNHNSHNQSLKHIGDVIFTKSFEVSCIQPRGKFQLSIYEHGITFVDTKHNERIVIPSHTIQHMIMFPKPEDCKNINHSTSKSKSNKNNKSPLQNVSSDMVVLVFSSKTKETTTAATDNNNDIFIHYKTKPIQQICFQLPNIVDFCKSNSSTSISSEQQDEENKINNDIRYDLPWNQTDINSKYNKRYTDLLSSSSLSSSTSWNQLHWSKQWMILLSLSLQYPFHQIAYAENPNHHRFKYDHNGIHQFKKQFISNTDQQISTTTSSLPYVTCHLGVQDGVLFPMEDGLLFYKPPSYYPSSILHAISISIRGGTMSGSRYLDLTIQLTNETNTTENHHNTKSNINNKKNVNQEIQFSNINKEEEGVLQNYVRCILKPAMERALRGISVDDIDDNSNNNKTIMDTSHNNDNSNGRRQKRKASELAREISKSMSHEGDNDDDGDDDDDDDTDFEIMDQDGQDNEETDDDDETESDDSVVMVIEGQDDDDDYTDPEDVDDGHHQDNASDTDTECYSN